MFAASNELSIHESSSTLKSVSYIEFSRTRMFAMASSERGELETGRALDAAICGREEDEMTNNDTITYANMLANLSDDFGVKVADFVDIGDLLAGVDEGTHVPDDFQGAITALLEAGAPGELKRLASAIGGYTLAPSSWGLSCDNGEPVKLPGGGYPEAQRLEVYIRGWATATWTHRQSQVGGVFTLRRTTGGNLRLLGDPLGIPEGEEEPLADSETSSESYLAVRTWKEDENDAHVYVLRFLSDGDVPTEKNPEVWDSIGQRLAQAWVSLLLGAYQRQCLLALPEWGGRGW